MKDESIRMRLLKATITIILVVVLTVVTQVGGVVWVVSLILFRIIDRKISSQVSRRLLKFLSFAALYFFFVFVLVPLVAKPFGRVPLPVFGHNHVKPAMIGTCLLNRHYVRPQLRGIVYRVAAEMNRRYPGVEVNYLDANFPFFDGFPLLPHLSHNDGRKLDISFQYNDAATRQMSSDVPSLIGYGICEEPRAGEQDMAKACAGKGHWQYDLLRRIMPQGRKDDFVFDEARTKMLINSFASQRGVSRIFLEPHLKTRLGLTHASIRFHGCQAVRHDDHIHVQIE
jgi:energy-coupling factor transporter transmembrane protein EcfT